jgi:hypothetical protein
MGPPQEKMPSQKKALLLSNYSEPKVLISKVRSVVLHDYYYLFFGSRCIEVTGE